MIRPRYIHVVGVHGKVKFNAVKGNKYTGTFQGADYGLIRFSSASPPGKDENLSPGMALKLLRDGQDSANLVAVSKEFGVDGEKDNWNFLSHTLSNHFPNPKGSA